MDVAVLPLFALFFTALVVTTTSKYDVLRVSIRRPRVFQLAAIGAAAVTVPVDLYALGHDLTGPAGRQLQDVAARLLLLNVAAACGLASRCTAPCGYRVTTGTGWVCSGGAAR